MKNLILVAMLATLVGCASTGDVEELHAHVDSDMKVMQDKMDTDMKAMAAEQARLTADHAAMNSKLDNMFKKSMSK
jgi:outer membrane murein-binding lipoprotein Lpp